MTMDTVALSDIYPAAFLCCAGLDYEVKSEGSPNGRRR